MKSGLLKSITNGYKVRKVMRNKDGSRTALLSKKGSMGLTVWYGKNGGSVVTKRIRYKR